MQIKKTKHLIDAITSYNGYIWNDEEIILTYSLSYPISKVAISSKNNIPKSELSSVRANIPKMPIPMSFLYSYRVFNKEGYKVNTYYTTKK